MFRLPAAATVCAFIALCVTAEAATLSVKEEMKDVVDPASNTLFAIGGEADPANGPDAPKVPNAHWKAAGEAADQLAAVAQGLTDPGRARPGPEWAGYAQQLREIAIKAKAAAMAKDGAALADVANALGDNCSTCHAKFKPQTGD